jgi:hypothetical protein
MVVAILAGAPDVLEMVVVVVQMAADWGHVSILLRGMIAFPNTPGIDGAEQR